MMRCSRLCSGILLLAACGRSELAARNGATDGPASEARAGSGGAASPGGAPHTTGASGGRAGVDSGGGEGGIAGSAAGPPSIQLDDFEDHQVLQRALNGRSRRVEIRGTVAGSSIDSVQVQVIRFEDDAADVVRWVGLAVDAEGRYSRTLEVPEGGWYRTVVRGLDRRGAEVARARGIHRWGVGINILSIGQSNMVGYGGRVYTAASARAGLYSNDRAWKHLADPYDSGGSSSDVDFDFGAGASLVPALVNALAEYFPHLPIGIVPAAKGSSSLVCAGSEPCWGARNGTDPADVSTLYGSSVTKARRAGGVELIVMHQGETDATQGTSRGEYTDALRRLARDYRADLGGELPLFLCQLGRSTSDVSVKNRTDVTLQSIRAAQVDADDPPTVYLAATAIDLDVDETDHYVKPTLDELGRRIAGAIAHHARAPGAPYAYRGPTLVAAAYADESRRIIDVGLRHRGGSDFEPAENIRGFVVLDDGAPVPQLSASRHDAATIRITLEAPVVGVASVRYLHGKLPFATLANTVHDNSRLVLPLEPTTDDLGLLPTAPPSP